MKKRILTVLLCLCMVISVLPMAALAQDAKPVFEISGTETELDTQYTSISEAVMAYIESEMPVCTMKLLDDAEIAIPEDSELPFGIMLNGDGDPSILDLGGHTLTVTGTGFAICSVTGSGAVNVIQNGKIVLNGSNLVGILNGNDYLEIRDVQIVAGETASDVVGIMCGMKDEGGHLTGTTVKNCQVALGDKGTDIVDEQSKEDHENFKTFIYSGQFSENPVSDENKNIVYAEGSSELTDTLSGVNGTVIKSANTTALIVENGNAYLYDTLQEAITAVENGRGSTEGTPATITLLKNTEEEVTLKTDTKFNVSTSDSSITNDATYKTEAGYEVKTDPETGTVFVEPVAVSGVSLSETSKTLSIGDTVTLTATVSPEDATNTDVVWSSSDEKVATVDENGTVTAVGYGRATITATVGGKTATCIITVPAPYIPPVNPNPSYSITAPSVDNGTLTVSPASATKNTDVTITVTPDKDYELASLTVIDANGNRVSVKQTGENKFTFTMPASKVTVSASFSKVVKTLPFTDVSADDYFFDAVVWAVENGVTYGNTATTFGVGVTCNRADAVTFIWRAYGCPAPKNRENPFTDVADSAYYADAVLWAVENGITVGTSATTFSPLESCRREHIVTFLYRAAGSPTVSHSSGFTDVADSAYYANAVTWAAENGITVGAGSTTTFGPTQNCFREQIVTFLYRNLAE